MAVTTLPQLIFSERLLYPENTTSSPSAWRKHSDSTPISCSMASRNECHCVQETKSGERRRSLRKGREKLFDILLSRNNGPGEEQSFLQSVSWSRSRLKNADKASVSVGGNQVCCVECQGVRWEIADERRGSDPFQIRRVLTSDQTAELLEFFETQKVPSIHNSTEDDVFEQLGDADPEVKKTNIVSVCIY